MDKSICLDAMKSSTIEDPSQNKQDPSQNKNEKGIVQLKSTEEFIEEVVEEDGFGQEDGWSLIVERRKSVSPVKRPVKQEERRIKKVVGVKGLEDFKTVEEFGADKKEIDGPKKKRSKDNSQESSRVGRGKGKRLKKNKEKVDKKVEKNHNKMSLENSPEGSPKSARFRVAEKALRGLAKESDVRKEIFSRLDKNSHLIFQPIENCRKTFAQNPKFPSRFRVPVVHAEAGEKIYYDPVTQKCLGYIQNPNLPKLWPR